MHDAYGHIYHCLYWNVPQRLGQRLACLCDITASQKKRGYQFLLTELKQCIELTEVNALY